MALLKDLTGQRFRKLTATKYVGNKHWLCQCDCGNVTIVKSCNLKSGHTKSCGCIAREQSAVNGRKRTMDLSGQRFGKLVAIEAVKKGNKRVWKCKCDCGNICYVTQNNLCRKTHGTTSCGCNVNHRKRNNVGNIKRKELLKNSKLGIRGVHYCKTNGIYIATIGFKGKRYYLKGSKDLQDCIDARKKAEQKIFGDFLEWYENERINKKGKTKGANPETELAPLLRP